MSTVTSPVSTSASRPRVVESLRAIQTLSDALDRMHSGMKGDMDMNASDLATLRMLTIREHRGQMVSPHDVAAHLRISTASTTKLIDRLVASGHLERRPHPSDGRARVVVLTDKSRREFFQHFGVRLGAMREIADRFDDTQLATVTRFMDELTEAIATDD
ncbi:MULTISPECIES: MarR family winged helix-turn-helix transcriptional regulator [Microbacterium]|uniref:MarR family winged helix-turn-helix transcriptional regulator n=1 Tax=Microbacterium TaxID=33882 RepID=UPI000AFEDFE1|nr:MULTISPECIES: MarR family transcriptional regulator [Microbacterium]